MFDSNLSQELFASIKSAIFGDFKLKELTLGNTFVRAEVSVDGQSIKVYQRFKTHKRVEPPQDVVLLGIGKLSDVLLSPDGADMTLVPKLVSESLSKLELANPHVQMVAFGVSIGLSSDQPEWYVLLEGEKDGKTEDRRVIFDRAGKYKRVLG